MGAKRAWPWVLPIALAAVLAALPWAWVSPFGVVGAIAVGWARGPLAGAVAGLIAGLGGSVVIYDGTVGPFDTSVFTRPPLFAIAGFAVGEIARLRRIEHSQLERIIPAHLADGGAGQERIVERLERVAHRREQVVEAFEGGPDRCEGWVIVALAALAEADRELIQRLLAEDPTTSRERARAEMETAAGGLLEAVRMLDAEIESELAPVDGKR